MFYYFSNAVSFFAGMVHIEQSERVVIGLDGNLYFSNVLADDSRNDYVCTAHYTAARTILPDTVARLTVLPSKYTHTHKCCPDYKLETFQYLSNKHKIQSQN